MPENDLFSILDTVDSTNNYAMAAVHAGLAKHGQAWFAREQTAGKGQRGKVWQSRPGENIALSIVLKPPAIFRSNPFLLNAVVSLATQRFFQQQAGKEIHIKWPNDIYWRDRKAGGILIENIFADKILKWSVAGIGLNINQRSFHQSLQHATSLYGISGRESDPAQLAELLYNEALRSINAFRPEDTADLLDRYNNVLFKKDAGVKLKKGSVVFHTNIKAVNEFGQLITEDSIERLFNFGEVEWVMG